MVKICEHTYKAEDPAHPGYSATETDLFPAVGGRGESYSVRHNKEADKYEVFDFLCDEPYTRDAVIFSGGLDDVIDYANMLEEDATGSSSFEYGHRPYLYGCNVEERLEL